MYYTIGQRQGLGIGGTESGSDLPWYVVDKQLSNNQLIVAQGGNHPALLATACEVTDIHWIDKAPTVGAHLTAKIRYRQQDSACRLEIDDKTTVVYFDENQRAVTPGQAIVFYRDEVCLGGATIVRALAPVHG